MFFWRKGADSFEVEAVGVKSAAGVAELRRGRFYANCEDIGRICIFAAEGYLISGSLTLFRVRILPASTSSLKIRCN